MPTDTDTPWHLVQGRLLLRRWADGQLGLDSRDSFSWTAGGLPWHPNAWGFDALLAGVYDVGSWAAVALFRLALLAALVTLAWSASRRLGSGRWARASAVWVTMLFIVPWSAVRPQLVTFGLLLVCLELTSLALGDRPNILPTHADRSHGRLGWPWSPTTALLALAAAVALWSTLHGAVVAGVAAVVAACAGDVVDRRTWRRPALTAAVAVAASCASPYGLGVWTHALTTSRDSAHENIEEWQPPSITSAEDVAVSVLLLTIVGAAVLLGRSGLNAQRWRLLAPGLLLTVLAFRAVRNGPLAMLALLPFTAHALGALGSFLERRGWALPVQPGRALGAMTIGAILGGAIQNGGLVLDPNPLKSSDYPRVASTLPSGCRLLNEYNFGGYLIFVRPDVPVSQDGRNDLYGPKRLREQERLLSDGDARRANETLRRLGVTCVLARPERELLRALARTSEWRRVATDGQAEVWIRSA